MQLKPHFRESIDVSEAHIFALIRAGQYEEAIRLCDEVIEKNKEPHVHYRL